MNTPLLRPWEKRELALRDEYCRTEAPAPGWKMIEMYTFGFMWDNPSLGLRVKQTVRVLDDKVWLHTSLSRPKKWRIPSYEDTARVKRLFCGDRLTVQAFVPAEQHVNIANILHLWTPIDDPDFNFPDFRLEVRPGVFDLA